MDKQLLSKTAAAMVAKGKGILAADESSGTCETRFKSVGIECTEESRRAYRGPVAIDARLKPGFPQELSADPATAALVTRRWTEYFPSGRVAMGDSERGHLD